MTCVAGLMIAAVGNPSKIVLTDGNDNAAKNLNEIIRENMQDGLLNCSNVAANLLRWDHFNHAEALEFGYFDFIIAADCLFVESFHSDLLNVIKLCLRPETGTAWIFAPSRKGSLQRFCDLANSHDGVQLMIREQYADKITHLTDAIIANSMPQFVFDIHYPILVEIKVLSRE